MPVQYLAYMQTSQPIQSYCSLLILFSYKSPTSDPQLFNFLTLPSSDF